MSDSTVKPNHINKMAYYYDNWPLSLFVCNRLWGPCPTTQIQSITDESRSSIRRKNQAAAQGANLSQQSSLMEDAQEDEVADFVNPTVPHC